MAWQEGDKKYPLIRDQDKFGRPEGFERLECPYCAAHEDAEGKDGDTWICSHCRARWVYCIDSWEGFIR